MPYAPTSLHLVALPVGTAETGEVVMRYLFGFVCVCALGFLPVVGCGDNNGGGGSGGSGGTAGTGGNGVACHDNVCPCSEAGIRAAIAEGGGPFTFACDGPQTVVTEAEIVIDNDVRLDGEGNLTVDGNDDHRVFSVPAGVTAELRGFTVTKGSTKPFAAPGGGIENDGTLTLTDSTVSGNHGGGIIDLGPLTLTNRTVSGNAGIGIVVGGGTLTLTNSTVSGNTGGGIGNAVGDVRLNSSTVSGNTEVGIFSERDASLTLTNSLVNGGCQGYITSNGNNIESPGDTCDLDQATDQVDVSADDLKLGPLADNGGLTMTHALLPGSFAIDQILEADCVDADGAPLTTDQRGVARPQGDSCDVGAFELEVAP